MDYEKAYKEALERARAGKPMNEVFPELHESEDERIRKEIINYLSNELHNVKQLTPRTNEFEAWIAYIAKQKEQTSTEGDNETEIQKAFREGKSAGRKEVFDHPEEYGLQKEQEPAEWSEEDENMINRCRMHLEMAVDGMPINIRPSFIEESNWLENRLKSLRPQPKREKQIKKRDKVKIHCRKDRKKDMVTTYDGKVGEVIYVWDAQRNPWGHIGVRLDNGCNNGFHEDELEILDEPHWKPSEEQMDALYDVLHPCDPVDKEKLESLYNDLKKLI